MDRRFLEEYQQKEKEKIKKFKKEMLNGNFRPNDVYPPLTRFKNLRTPMIRACQAQTDLNTPSIIYPQIPFSGSLMVDLIPVKEKHFMEVHGFTTQDISRLVEFSKETGKVQFVLSQDATFYDGLDFLDPIFVDLRPPQISHIPLVSIASEDELKKYQVEFDTVAELRARPMIWHEYDYLHFNNHMKWSLWIRHTTTYALLKALGKDDIAEQILNALIDDPDLAWSLLITYGSFFSMPLLDSQRISHNHSLEIVTEFVPLLKGRDRGKVLGDITLPCEVGAFLMRKLTPHPETFRATQLLVDKYKDEDLYNIMEALSNGIKSKSPDLLTTKAEELEIILDNLWKDSRKIKREIEGVNFGISFTLGVIGPIVGYMAASVFGLLAALGLTVVEKSVDFFGSSIGEKTVKKLRPSWLVGVYDFKSQHSLE